MGELKPEITVNEKWGNFSLQVDIDCPYTEDYQMKMLGHNVLQGILQVKGNEADKKSRYMYRTQGMTRLSRKYETEEIGRDGICTLLEQVITAADELKRYLLDPDCLLLAPECIFEKDGRYGFCYIPVRVKPLCRSLHELTEFFLEKLDYRDTEGVFLACLLHKETMKEGYDLAEILRKYKADEAARLHTPDKSSRYAGDAGRAKVPKDEQIKENKRTGAVKTKEVGRAQPRESDGAGQAQTRESDGAGRTRPAKERGVRQKPAVGEAAAEAVETSAAAEAAATSAAKESAERTTGTAERSAPRTSAAAAPGIPAPETPAAATAKISAPETSAEEDSDLFIVDEDETGVRGYCARPGKTSYASYITGSAPMVIREEGKKYGPLKKLGKRLKTGYWGNWGDLITEAKEERRYS